MDVRLREIFGAFVVLSVCNVGLAGVLSWRLPVVSEPVRAVQVGLLGLAVYLASVGIVGLRSSR